MFCDRKAQHLSDSERNGNEPGLLSRSDLVGTPALLYDLNLA